MKLSAALDALFGRRPSGGADATRAGGSEADDLFAAALFEAAAASKGAPNDGTFDQTGTAAQGGLGEDGAGTPGLSAWPDAPPSAAACSEAARVARAAAAGPVPASLEFDETEPMAVDSAAAVSLPASRQPLPRAGAAGAPLAPASEAAAAPPSGAAAAQDASAPISTTPPISAALVSTKTQPTAAAPVHGPVPSEGSTEAPSALSVDRQDAEAPGAILERPIAAARRGRGDEETNASHPHGAAGHAPAVTRAPTTTLAAAEQPLGGAALSAPAARDTEAPLVPRPSRPARVTEAARAALFDGRRARPDAPPPAPQEPGAAPPLADATSGLRLPVEARAPSTFEGPAAEAFELAPLESGGSSEEAGSDAPKSAEDKAPEAQVSVGESAPEAPVSTKESAPAMAAPAPSIAQATPPVAEAGGAAPAFRNAPPAVRADEAPAAAPGPARASHPVEAAPPAAAADRSPRARVSAAAGSSTPKRHAGSTAAVLLAEPPRGGTERAVASAGSSFEAAPTAGAAAPPARAERDPGAPVDAGEAPAAATTGPRAERAGFTPSGGRAAPLAKVARASNPRSPQPTAAGIDRSVSTEPVAPAGVTATATPRAARADAPASIGAGASATAALEAASPDVPVEADRVSASEPPQTPAASSETAAAPPMGADVPPNHEQMPALEAPGAADAARTPAAAPFAFVAPPPEAVRAAAPPRRRAETPPAAAPEPLAAAAPGRLERRAASEAGARAERSARGQQSEGDPFTAEPAETRARRGRGDDTSADPAASAPLPFDPAAARLEAPARDGAPAPSAPIYAAAERDPDLRVAVSPQAAHLHVAGEDGRDLSLHLRLRDGSADVRVTGGAAPLFAHRAPEIQAALAGAGVALGSFNLDGGRGGGGRGEGTAEGPEERGSRLDARARSRNARGEASATAGRIHVKA